MQCPLARIFACWESVYVSRFRAVFQVNVYDYVIGSKLISNTKDQNDPSVQSVSKSFRIRALTIQKIPNFLSAFDSWLQIVCRSFFFSNTK